MCNSHLIQKSSEKILQNTLLENDDTIHAAHCLAKYSRIIIVAGIANHEVKSDDEIIMRAFKVDWVQGFLSHLTGVLHSCQCPVIFTLPDAAVNPL